MSSDNDDRAEDAGRSPPDEQWYMAVDGATYGPYGAQRMRDFQAEGRLFAESHVCRNGGDAWIRALDDPVLGTLFDKTTEAHTIVATAVEDEPDAAQSKSAIQRPASPDAGEKLKSPLLALLLSFLIIGVGQMYNGQIGKGFGMLIGGILLWIIFLGWIIWIWSMIDAYRTAEAINRSHAAGPAQA